MRFIDWKGKKEDRFNDVLDYAKSQQEESLRREKDNRVSMWITKVIGDKSYTKLIPSDILKLLIVRYRELLRIKEILYKTDNRESQVDKEQLWCDFWCETVVRNLNRITTEQSHQQKLFEVFVNKIFKFSEVISLSDYFEYRNNLRYKKYINRCFDFENLKDNHYLKLLYSFRKTDVIEFINIYSQWIVLLEYYLYYTFNPKTENWMGCVEKELDALNIIKDQIEKNIIEKPDYRKLKSPFSKENMRLLSEVKSVCRVVLFKLEKREKEDDKMIEILYSSILDNCIDISHLDSIMPEKVKLQIQHGILPEYDKTNRMFLSDDEAVHYMNHSVLFHTIDVDDDTEFKKIEGIIYLTGKRIVFEGKQSVSVSYDRINKIVYYDMIPEILEVCFDSAKYYFQVPDAEMTLKVFKLVSDLNKGKAVYKEKTEYTYESLLEENSIDTCVFAIKNVANNGIGEEIEEQLGTITDKLEKIQKAAEKYPERKSEIEAFVVQYVPEAVKLLLSYKQYNEIGYDAVSKDQLYDKLRSTLTVLSEALYKKIYNIYQEQAIDIIAQANVLAQSLEGENVIREKLPFEIDALAEEADVKACIFAFEYIKGYNLEQEMKTEVESIYRKLLGLKKTIETYPDRENEVQRFLRYYIPEAVRIVVSYNQYKFSGLDEITMNKVYNRVMESLNTLNAAIETKIKDIFKLATMNTVAQADALKTILGQDGFAPGNNILKH